MPSSASLPGSWSAARRGRAKLQRVRRPDGRAGSGEEHEADVLEPATDLALARRVRGDAVDRVLRQAVDGQRRAPVTGVTAAAVELLHPARRVEPPFREGRSRIDTPDPERAHIGITCRSDRAPTPRNGNAEKDDRADDLHARGSVPRRTRPPVKAPRMTQDPCGILRVQAAASAVLPLVTAGFLVPGRVGSRVACRIRQEPDQRSRARASLPARQNGRSGCHRRHRTGQRADARYWPHG